MTLNDYTPETTEERDWRSRGGDFNGGETASTSPLLAWVVVVMSLLLLIFRSI